MFRQKRGSAGNAFDQTVASMTKRLTTIHMLYLRRVYHERIYREQLNAILKSRKSSTAGVSNVRKKHRSRFHLVLSDVGSTDPTHAGVLSFMRRRYSKNLEGASTVVWGIPFDAATSNRPGARFGPQAIRRASAIFDNDPQYPFARDLFENMPTVDYGDCLLDYGDHWQTPETIEREARKILANSEYLLTLGGDHFITCRS